MNAFLTITISLGLIAACAVPVYFFCHDPSFRMGVATAVLILAVFFPVLGGLKALKEKIFGWKGGSR